MMCLGWSLLVIIGASDNSRLHSSHSYT